MLTVEVVSCTRGTEDEPVTAEVTLLIKDGMLLVLSLSGTLEELSLSFVVDCTITVLPLGRRVAVGVELFLAVLLVLSLSRIEMS